MSNSLQGKHIAWLIPNINSGSGGLQTIFRHAAYLNSLGAICDFHIIPDGTLQNEIDASRIIETEYNCPNCHLFPNVTLNESYDAVIATMWNSVKYATASGIKHRFYFVQDFEPWFYPMGNEYIEAECTYLSDLTPITIGNWLAEKLHKEFCAQAYVTDFCCDSELYYDLHKKRDHALCAVFQPEKPRRCAQLIIDTLELLHSLDPTLSIYAFGSPTNDARLERFASNLQVLSKQQCNELYNRCEVGLTISTSNPSRIPFEMMASGLPVVDIYRENNLYDFDEKSILLAKPTADALASAIMTILNDASRRKRMQEAGKQLMAERPISKETEQFASHIASSFHPTPRAHAAADKRYRAEPFQSSEHISTRYQAMINKSLSRRIEERNNCYRQMLASAGSTTTKKHSAPHQALHWLKQKLFQ